MNASNVEKFSCTRMQHNKHAVTCLGCCAQRHGSKMSEGQYVQEKSLFLTSEHNTETLRFLEQVNFIRTAFVRTEMHQRVQVKTASL
jgi:hypothetical protein